MTNADNNWKRLPTWREDVAAGRKTWDDYVCYRLNRLDTADMEYMGYDAVMHECFMEFPMKVVYSHPMSQAHISIGESS